MATRTLERMFEEEERGKGRTSTPPMSYFIIKAAISPEFLEASCMTYWLEMCHVGTPNFKEGWESE